MTRFQVDALPIGALGAPTNLDEHLLEWDAIARRNMDVGTFTGTLDINPGCCAALAQVPAYHSLLRVTERATGCVLWEGVIYANPLASGGTSREAGNVELLAYQYSPQWIKWRVMHDTIDTTTTPRDGCLVAADIIVSALRIDDPGVLDHLVIIPGAEAVSITAKLGKSAWTALGQIVPSQVTIGVHGRRLIIAPAGACIGDLGMFDATMFEGDWVLQQGGDDAYYTSAWVSGKDDLLVNVGGTVAGVLIETEITDTNLVDEAAAIAAGAAKVSANIPVRFLADGTESWLACDADVDICRLATGACLSMTANSCGINVSAGMVLDQVRFARQDGEDRVGVSLTDKRTSTGN